MNDQLNLMEQVSTQITRGEAEVLIRESAANYRERVYAFIRDHGPVTDEQIAFYTALNPNTARPRRLELERAGRIQAAGASRTRAGRRAIAWASVPDPAS